MKSLKYIVAATELLLVFPALLFMTALFVRNLQPQQFEPAPEHNLQGCVEPPGKSTGQTTLIAKPETFT
jgi:hypothetical protein